VVHTAPIKDPIFEASNFNSVDAVVLEAYHSEEWFEKLWKSEFKKHHEAIFQNAQRTKKPVYVTDVLTTSNGRSFEDIASLLPDFMGLMAVYDGANKVKKHIKEKDEMTRRQFLKFWGKQSAKIAIGAYLGSDLICRNYVIQSGQTPETLARLNSSRMHLMPTPQFELRNAISARKIEEFIVPELQQRLGRNPSIVLVFGAGHSGLKEDLQHKRLRDFYLGSYSLMGFPGIDTTYLDTITELSIGKDGQYLLNHRQARLFCK
jgi:hypothetical protein